MVVCHEVCIDKTIESHNFILFIILLYFVIVISICLSRIKSKWVFALGKKNEIEVSDFHFHSYNLSTLR